jgi:Family of unknown function (DUF6283)
MKLKKPCKNCPMLVAYNKPEWTDEQIANLEACDTQSFSQMACHKSKEDEPTRCVGWVISQLKNGVENIGLRLAIIRKEVVSSEYDLSMDVHPSIKKAFENKRIKVK